MSSPQETSVDRIDELYHQLRETQGLEVEELDQVLAAIVEANLGAMLELDGQVTSFDRALAPILALDCLHQLVTKGRQLSPYPVFLAQDDAAVKALTEIGRMLGPAATC